MGGDEFVLILHDQSNEEIIYRAMQRISGKVNARVLVKARRSARK